MTIAAFDLDHTLLAGDSEVEWNKFIMAAGLVDVEFHKPIYLKHIKEYHAGTLDINKSASHTTYIFARISQQEADRKLLEFTHDIIAPLIREQADEWLSFHRKQQHTNVLITATNSLVAEPIGKLLNMDHTIGNRVKLDRQAGTSRLDLDYPPSFKDGKPKNLHLLGEKIGENLTDLWAYSDSFNDIPLLQAAKFPKVVCPDDTLRAHAIDQGWPIILD